mgnify:CR=1 FL=1
MDEITNSSLFDNMDVQEFDDLMELVFAYTAAAHDFGFTHKMNNRFTALSMNASFLMKALANKDYDKATLKAAQVSESISTLVKYSQNLMNTEIIPSGSQLLEFPQMITQTIGKLLNLPPFKDIDVKQDFYTDALSTDANPGIIWIVLYAYFKNAKRYDIEGPIHLTTTLDKESNQYSIKTDVKRILKSPAPGPEESALVFPSAGEMPLRYLGRVIRNVSPQFELLHQTDRPLNIELKITLSSQN